MNAQTLERLWYVAEVKDHIGKDGAVAQYLALVKQEEKKIHMKQGNNSFDLDNVNNNIGVCEEKILGFQEERKKVQVAIKRLETQLRNLEAQEKAEFSKKRDFEEFQRTQLEEEAAALTDAIQEIKEVESALLRESKRPMEDRFLGKNGDGSATYLRNIHGLASISDLNSLNGKQRRALLTFAAAFGAETMTSWVRKWESPPIEKWTEIAGAKVGGILCHNGVPSEKAGQVLFHLYDLSPPDDSPIKTRKRGRSFSHGDRSPPFSRRDRSASRSGNKRRRRRILVSRLEAASEAFGDLAQLLEEGVIGSDESDNDSEQE